MSSHFDSEPTASLDELYQYRGEQLGCAYRGARIVFFLITAAVGVFFGYYPARRATALNPIQALRHE